jgi:hypothetical protein
VQPNIEAIYLRTPVMRSTLHRPSDRLSISIVNLQGLRGIVLQSPTGNVFTPETNVLEIRYTEPQEPVPVRIQGTKERGSHRSGPRATS